MAKARTMYVCNACGVTVPKWAGRCPDCGAWDSFEERSAVAMDDPRAAAAAAWAGAASPAASPASSTAPQAVLLTEAHTAQGPTRVSTGIAELDRVLGADPDTANGASPCPIPSSTGLVQGSAVLLGGDPGIGKSTLLLQAAGSLAAHGAKTLYVSSEESVQQVASRAKRLRTLGSCKAANANLMLLADTHLSRVIEQASHAKPAVLIIDSIQMLHRVDIDSAPGSVAQLRRCCADLVHLAKATGVAVVLVGHVTKEGALAGPRLIEHMVDAVLYFEGDRYQSLRVLRGVKNRFGATQEVGLFEMTGSGLQEASPGAGLAQVAGAARPGAALCPTAAGARCVLVEVQALTAAAFPGSAKRRASGLDSNRLAMLLAVLEQHAGVRLADRDVFASAVGGIRVHEPAADLALALAVAGAHQNLSLPEGCAVAGEVGLGGEVRPVSQLQSRLSEASRLGCTKVIAPPGAKKASPKGLRVVEVDTIGAALARLQQPASPARAT